MVRRGEEVVRRGEEVVRRGKEVVRRGKEVVKRGEELVRRGERGGKDVGGYYNISAKGFMDTGNNTTRMVVYSHYKSVMTV